MATQPKIVADFEVQLSTAISVGATSFSLSSIIDDDGVTIPNGLYYFTVDNGSSNKEYLSGTVTGTAVTSVVSVSRQGAETSGAVRAHRVGASVIITDFATYKKYLDNATIAGAPDASQSVKGLVEVAIAAEIDSDSATGATGAYIATTPDQLALSKYGTRLPTVVEKAALAGLAGLTGAILPYAGSSAPSGFLLADGSAVSRSTYAALFAIVCPSAVTTITIASPGVFSSVAHGLIAGDRIHLTTTGGLPSGLAANTDYYIISAGLTADAFEVALSPGGAAINTSGSQSGVHTFYKSSFGRGDGSTTFNVPDLRAKMPVGRAATAPTMTLSFEPASVTTGTDLVTIIDTVFPSQGQKVQLTTTGTLPAGLSLATDYFIVRASSTTIKFSTSQSNANAGTVVDITDQGSGVHTMTFTDRTHTVLGRVGGEETHGTSTTELAAHVHSATNGQPFLTSQIVGGAGAALPSGGNTQVTSTTTDTTGGNTQHNNMPPFVVLNYIIKT